MAIWALSDLHLAFGVPSKSMQVFGPAWENYAERIAKHWKESVADDDLVLIPGDISWAKTLDEALVDLKWIDALPGQKIILRGNHDYWWASSAKLTKIMPPSIQFIHNNAVMWKDVAIGGTRLWDTEEYNFAPFIAYRENPRERVKSPEELFKQKEEDQKIFARELERLRLSLSQLDPSAKLRIALVHYPPVGADLAPSLTSKILEEFRIDYCVFGHLHSIKENALEFGSARGVNYLFTSCDYLNFIPKRVV